LAATAYGATMLVGLALYPTYKVRVRSEYLENPSAIRRATEARAADQELAEVRNQESRRFRLGEAREAKTLTQLSDDDRNAIAMDADARVHRGVKLSRWFDVKEHWSALGLILAGAIALLLWVSPPGKPDRRIATTTMALALLSAGIAWTAAVIGILVTAARSVAGI